MIPRRLTGALAALALGAGAPICAATITGTVQSGGKAVVGAMVTVSSADGLVNQTVYSDASGAFRLATNLDGKLSIRARAPMLADETHSISVPKGNRELKQAFAMRVLTTPQEISDSLPASAHFARIKFPTTMQRDQFQTDCLSCHEIGNPLAAISTGIQYLLEQIPPGDPAYTTLTLIRQENERLNQLLEDVLLMSRPPRLQAVCSITHILDDVLGRAHATAALNQIRIVRQFSPDTPTVRGDATRLEQAMSNLIANAIQAMPEGGILNVRTRKDTARGGDGALQMMPERMLSATSGPWAVIEIEDTGVGIPNGDLPRIFSPFFTTKRSGTGLGLTITQRIVGEHGGEVAVNSDPGRGTLFTVRLPAAV